RTLGQPTLRCLRAHRLASIHALLRGGSCLADEFVSSRGRVSRCLFLPPATLQLIVYGAQFWSERPADIWIACFDYFFDRRSSKVACGVSLKGVAILLVDCREFLFRI